MSSDISAFTSPDADELDPRDVEIARLRAENESLRMSAGPNYTEGHKYRVSLKDGPTAVVQCENGEHPYEAFKRVTGVISSMHGPEIHQVDDETECGILHPVIAR